MPWADMNPLFFWLIVSPPAVLVVAALTAFFERKRP